MKLVSNAISLSILALSLSACAFVVTDEGISRYDDDDYKHKNRMTLTLPDGDRVTFSCPRDMETFVIDETEEGGSISYGCRSEDS
ncbi:hypothetical protein GCM10017044_01410 [Kordiimonas sediminis]|uniref:Uncharacterized protein n=1 Tax=Kordiimonas sediminis TaxID=1735581 RepID=A0A919AJN0_9PROT|nr:hypothetical protein [Kordiimonas sediminis]GHF11378.1 hypothetical protein GCM10017044_01410 [Kordiimonas sediminis]